MTLNEYQESAYKHDKNKKFKGKEGLSIPLLGLTGEVGSLASEYKKFLRDKDDYTLFDDQFKEDIGDCLWYLSNLASKLDYELDEICKLNLKKIKGRFPVEKTKKIPTRYDESAPEKEQLPRLFFIIFNSEDEICKMQISFDNSAYCPLGDSVTDNSYEEDGYRFHDIIHLFLCAKLGWSPVIRSLLRKNK